MANLDYAGQGIDELHVLFDRIERQTPLNEIHYLNLSGNNIECLNPLHRLPNLRQVDLSNNQIHSLTSLKQPLLFLKELDVSFNRLTSLTGLSKLPELEVLIARNNRITSLQALDELHSVCSKLRVLDLEQNSLHDIQDLGWLAGEPS